MSLTVLPPVAGPGRSALPETSGSYFRIEHSNDGGEGFAAIVFRCHGKAEDSDGHRLGHSLAAHPEIDHKLVTIDLGPGAVAGDQAAVVELVDNPVAARGIIGAYEVFGGLTQNDTGRRRQITVAGRAAVAQHFTGDAQRSTAVLRRLEDADSGLRPFQPVGGQAEPDPLLEEDAFEGR